MSTREIVLGAIDKQALHYPTKIENFQINEITEKQQIIFIYYFKSYSLYCYLVVLFNCLQDTFIALHLNRGNNAAELPSYSIQVKLKNYVKCPLSNWILGELKMAKNIIIYKCQLLLNIDKPIENKRMVKC